MLLCDVVRWKLRISNSLCRTQTCTTQPTVLKTKIAQIKSKAATVGASFYHLHTENYTLLAMITFNTGIRGGCHPRAYGSSHNWTVNGGTLIAGWFAYFMENTIWDGWFGGTPTSGNHHIYGPKVLHVDTHTHVTHIIGQIVIVPRHDEVGTVLSGQKDWPTNMI